MDTDSIKFPLFEIRNESANTCWKPRWTVEPADSCKCKSSRTNGRDLRRWAPRTNFLQTIQLLPQFPQANEATFSLPSAGNPMENTILTQINSARRIPENTILQPSWSARFKCDPKQFSLPNRSNRSNDMLKQFSQRSRMNPLIPFCIQGLARQYGIESIYNRNCA